MPDVVPNQDCLPKLFACNIRNVGCNNSTAGRRISLATDLISNAQKNDHPLDVCWVSVIVGSVTVRSVNIENVIVGKVIISGLYYLNLTSYPNK